MEETLIALNPRKKIPFTLVEKTVLSRDSRKLRFALQSPKHILGLPVGKHMFFYAQVNGNPVMRAYTPSSSNSLVGYFDLVIKVYFANENPRFPDGGKMSQVRIADTNWLRLGLTTAKHTHRYHCILAPLPTIFSLGCCTQFHTGFGVSRGHQPMILDGHVKSWCEDIQFSMEQ